MIICASTGWLYAEGINLLSQQEKILTASDADGLEVCMDGWKNDKRIISLRRNKFNLKSFVYRSLHLPDVNNQQIKHQLAITQEIISLINAAVALTHPLKVNGQYPLKCYEEMVANDIPLAIENMDKRKDSGFILAELGDLTHLGLNFILDTQHAYERDPDMNYATDLFYSLQNKLIHLHVSGEADNNQHSLVSRSKNAKKIIEFLGMVLAIKKVPLVIEGKYQRTPELKAEIEFLRNELD